MKKADVKVGQIVGAKSDEELKKPFQGKVEKIYENSAMLAITSYDPVDKSAVSDLNNKIVVNFKKMKTAKAAKNSKTAATNEVKIEKIAKKDNKKKAKKTSKKKATKKTTAKKAAKPKKVSK